MKKQFLKFTAVAAVIFTMVFTGGCEKDIKVQDTATQGTEMIKFSSGIQDQSKYLYENGFIEKATYENWLASGVNFYSSTKGVENGGSYLLFYPTESQVKTGDKIMNSNQTPKDLDFPNSLTFFQSTPGNKKIESQLKWLLDRNEISKGQYDDWIKSGVKFNVQGALTEITLVYPVNDTDTPATFDYVDVNMKNESIKSANARHRVASTMFGGGTITVAVHSAGMSNDWYNAIIYACQQWNNLGYNVKFSPYLTTNNNPDLRGELDIRYENYAGLTSNDLAYTNPIADNGGSAYIIINKGGTSVSQAIKQFAIMHELGHSIGFNHTDTYDGNAATTKLTCNGPANVQSLMRKNVVTGTGIDGLGFTTCDVQNIAYYFPKKGNLV